MVYHDTYLTQTPIDVPEKNIELYEINDFETHDEIKTLQAKINRIPIYATSSI